jgi:hypothetical protein
LKFWEQNPEARSQDSGARKERGAGRRNLTGGLGDTETRGKIKGQKVIF